MDNLRLIVSSKGQDIGFHERWKALGKIEQALFQSRKLPYRGPATARGVLVGFGTAISLFSISVSIHMPTFPIANKAITSAALGLVMGLLVYRRIPHKTWNDWIYELLARYQPIDIAGYAQLQDAVRKQGLRVVDLTTWLHRERDALRQTMPVQASKVLAADSRPKYDFLNRKP